MKVIHSPKHILRNPETELYGGRLVRPFECPERVEHILAALNDRGMTDIAEPADHGLEPVLRVHDADFVEFLSTVWDAWKAGGYKGEAIPTAWPSRRMWRAKPPKEIDGRLGYYALAGETSISEGTWEAARSSADSAISAAELVEGGERTAFALCRPPGHHAASDMYGGYCFLNNAAIAAQHMRDNGAARVAVLDVDFHHGNGTQAIFWERGDVMFLSMHGEPETAFPYYLGGADETGAGAGEGTTVNYPMPKGTAWDVWGEALCDAAGRIADYRPDALVVSLGTDAFENDPISYFKLTSEDFIRIGDGIAKMGLPTLFVMEGGYAVAEIGINTVNVLEGFEQGCA